MVPIPDRNTQASLAAKINDLADAIQDHPEFKKEPQPHPGLYHVWDFVKRTHYIVTELDNIRQGNALQYPNLVPAHAQAKDNEERAQMSFTDVVTRTMTIDMLIRDPQKLSAMGLPNVEIGDDILNKSAAVSEACFAVPE